jgi:hypothetical protein
LQIVCRCNGGGIKSCNCLMQNWIYAPIHFDVSKSSLG